MRSMGLSWFSDAWAGWRVYTEDTHTALTTRERPKARSVAEVARYMQEALRTAA